MPPLQAGGHGTGAAAWLAGSRGLSAACSRLLTILHHTSTPCSLCPPPTSRTTWSSSTAACLCQQPLDARSHRPHPHITRHLPPAVLLHQQPLDAHADGGLLRRGEQQPQLHGRRGREVLAPGLLRGPRPGVPARRSQWHAGKQRGWAVDTRCRWSWLLKVSGASLCDETSSPPDGLKERRQAGRHTPEGLVPASAADRAGSVWCMACLLLGSMHCRAPLLAPPALAQAPSWGLVINPANQRSQHQMHLRFAPLLPANTSELVAGLLDVEQFGTNIRWSACWSCTLSLFAACHYFATRGCASHYEPGSATACAGAFALLSLWCPRLCSCRPRHIRRKRLLDHSRCPMLGKAMAATLRSSKRNWDPAQLRQYLRRHPKRQMACRSWGPLKLRRR